MDFERLPVLKRTKHSSTVYPTQVQMAPIRSLPAAIPCTSTVYVSIPDFRRIS